MRGHVGKVTDGGHVTATGTSLTQKLAALRADYDRLEALAAAAVAAGAWERIQRLTAEAERDAARAALERVQWCGGTAIVHHGACPACGWHSAAGHGPGCWLAAALGGDG